MRVVVRRLLARRSWGEALVRDLPPLRTERIRSEIFKAFVKAFDWTDCLLQTSCCLNNSVPGLISSHTLQSWKGAAQFPSAGIQDQTSMLYSCPESCSEGYSDLTFDDCSMHIVLRAVSARCKPKHWQ
jgi:hypothetical protein